MAPVGFAEAGGVAAAGFAAGAGVAAGFGFVVGSGWRSVEIFAPSASGLAAVIAFGFETCSI
jgi:hypothetical protein